MKLLVSAGLVVALLPLVVGQETASAQKHLTIAPRNGHRAVALAARSIERGLNYPSVVILNGNVEIKTPICFGEGLDRKPICDGEMIVRADTAKYHEDTGEIEARGVVVVTPLRHEPKR